MQRTYTVLYVDDDIDDLNLISEAFEIYTDNLTVIHAGNGADGLRILNQMREHNNLPCLLIIDINMPILDGRRMLKELREVWNMMTFQSSCLAHRLHQTIVSSP